MDEGWFQLPALEPSKAYVWALSVSAIRAELSHLYALLAPDERSRAQRFVSIEARDHFIVGRACLRLILSHLLLRPPQALQFAYGDQGKPTLPENELAFNVSHSGDAVLVAVSRAGSIGVDVETIRYDIECGEIAKQILSIKELRRFAKLPEARRVAMFFQYWSAKEAVAKAIGAGLTIPLPTIEVGTHVSGSVARKVRCLEVGSESLWFSYELQIGPRYVAALAADSSRLQTVICRPFGERGRGEFHGRRPGVFEN